MGQLRLCGCWGPQFLLIGLTNTIVIGLGIASVFTGGWAAKSLFGADRVERFTKQYRQAILERIDAELQKRDLPGSVRKNVEDVSAAIKTKADRRGDGLD